MTNSEYLTDSNTFSVYDASAGSGKTFTLVKEYLKRLLEVPDDGYYRHLLAITFTNKAVSEMKSRIVKNLMSIASQDEKEEPNPMTEIISSEIDLNKKELQHRARKVLHHLLHHYSNFSIETIDHFNHRLIRTFSRDLKLPSNFDVDLDADLLLAEAVDQLLSKTGTDTEYTQLLVDFALEKTDADKSWDIQRELLGSASLLTSENDSAHLEKYKSRNLSDFNDFLSSLKNLYFKTSTEIINLSTDLLTTFESKGLNASHFSGGYLYKYFLKLKTGDVEKLEYDKVWQDTLGDKPLYPGRVKGIEADSIDELAPDIVEVFSQSKAKVIFNQLLHNILKNLVPLSVVSLINREVQQIKEERNILPIWEFNPIIHGEIKDQPAPYIYERLGERYRHFFIDEFQDTSRLQWQNLIPLVQNALSQQYADGTTGSLMLVGDAKQSIYRWRGGLPEQFIELCYKNSPFPGVSARTEELLTNYRSRKNIVQFNNDFFKYASGFLSDGEHLELFETGTYQRENDLPGGRISIEFYENQQSETDPNCTLVLERVRSLVENDYSLRDICVLTRKRQQGVTIGDHLLEHGIPVVSSEVLLLSNSPVVNFLIDLLTNSIFRNHEYSRVSLFSFIYHRANPELSKHDFLKQWLSLSDTKLKDELTKFNVDFDPKHFLKLPLYDSMEYALRAFALDAEADAYVFGFMEEVHTFSRQPQATKNAFLEYWELKKEKLSIASNPNANAVQIMTIHKAKGLEFPVVIFPWADVKFYEEKNAKAWLPWHGEGTELFNEVYLSFNKRFQHYNEEAAFIYAKRRGIQELDAMNLLYVALTRAVDQLHLFCELPSNSNQNIDSYNKLFIGYLKNIGKWSDVNNVYEFGNRTDAKSASKTSPYLEVRPEFISTPLEDHELTLATRDAVLWETPAQEAINTGNLIHYAMARILRSSDIDPLLEELKKNRNFGNSEIELMETAIRNISSHPELKNYFESDLPIWTEREIFMLDGNIVRPDRVQILPDRSLAIMDYKTGEFSGEYHTQITRYAGALEQMGHAVSARIIIYYNQGEIIINKL